MTDPGERAGGVSIDVGQEGGTEREAPTGEAAGTDAPRSVGARAASP